jgi:hypothetical protein
MTMIKPKYTSYRKGKTYEEIYGIERANEQREKRRIHNRGKTYEELYGNEKAKIMKDCTSKRSKGKIISEEHKNILRTFRLGKKLSDETKQKIGIKSKGRIFSEEHKKKISLGNKGKIVSKETIEKIKKANIGREHTEEAKLNMSEARKGNKNHFYGKQHTNESKEKISKQNKGKLKGDKNPAWLGGKSFEPYCPKFNIEFKNLVRLRDNFCCLNCGISEQKWIMITKRKLAIHHIDYNKKNTCLQNCCALCDSCNTKANKNREQWTEYFREKLSQKYNYQYDDIGNVLIDVETINDTNINLFGLRRGDDDDDDF